VLSHEALLRQGVADPTGTHVGDVELF